MTKVISTEQTRNPLFLEIFLEEMCSFGDFFLVDKQMDHLLEAERYGEQWQLSVLLFTCLQYFPLFLEFTPKSILAIDTYN